MKKITIMRCLREKYRISTKELSEAASVSQQYISALDLGRYHGWYEYRKSGGPLVEKAFENVAEKRIEQAGRLKDDIERNRGRLLDFVEDHNEL